MAKQTPQAAKSYCTGTWVWEGLATPIVWQKCKKNVYLKFHVKVPVHVARQPLEQIRQAYIQLRGDHIDRAKYGTLDEFTIGQLPLFQLGGHQVSP